MALCFSITDVNWGVTKDFFSIVGVIVSAVAAGGAFYIGAQGLKTWRRQLRGNDDHQLARRALIELYKFRDALNTSRSPLVLVSLNLEDGKAYAEEHFKGMLAEYQRRLEGISQSRISLQASEVEAEAVWSNELKSLLQPIFKLHDDYAYYLTNHLLSRNPNLSQDVRRGYEGDNELYPNILYRGGKEKDQFQLEFESSLLKVELYLKNKLIP